MSLKLCLGVKLRLVLEFLLFQGTFLTSEYYTMNQDLEIHEFIRT